MDPDVAQNNYQQDGASINSFAGGGGVADGGGNVGIGVVNPDAIQEFKIQTSQFDASYGRNPGANVDVVTKSGTNQFHGSGFEFFRNTILNANDFFRKLSPAPNNTRQVLNQNQFGGAFGGPGEEGQAVFLRVLPGDPAEKRNFPGGLFHSHFGWDSLGRPLEYRYFSGRDGRGVLSRRTIRRQYFHWRRSDRLHRVEYQSCSHQSSATKECRWQLPDSQFLDGSKPEHYL